MARSILSELADPEKRAARLKKAQEAATGAEHKLTDLQGQLQRAQSRWLEKSKQLDGDPNNEKLQGQVRTSHKRMKDKEEAVERAQKRYDEAKAQLELIQALVIRLEQMVTPDAGTVLASEMEELAQELLAIAAQVTALSKRREQPTLLLREFVTHHPTGFTHSDTDEGLGNKLWVSPSGTLIVELVPNPDYGVALDEAEQKLGKDAVRPFLQVDVKALYGAAKAGTLKDQSGDSVAPERIELMRERTDHPHKVVVRRLDEKTGEILISIINPDLTSQRLAELETLRDLGPEAIRAFAENGIETVGDLGKLDLFALGCIKGIGETRALEIFKAARRVVGRRIR